MSYIFNRISPSPEVWESIESTYDGTVYKTKQWFDFINLCGGETFVCEVADRGG